MSTYQTESNDSESNDSVIGSLVESLTIFKCEISPCGNQFDGNREEIQFLYYTKELSAEELPVQDKSYSWFQVGETRIVKRLASNICGYSRIQIKFDIDQDEILDQKYLRSRVFLRKRVLERIQENYQINAGEGYIDIYGHLKNTLVLEDEQVASNNDRPFFFVRPLGCDEYIKLEIDDLNSRDSVILWFEKPRVSASSSSSCFIATACGADVDSIKTLQNFRDSKLKNSSIGRAFVVNYEKFSPPVAAIIARSPFLSMTIHRGLIKPIVFLLRSQKK